MIERLLDGETGPRRDIVLLNAGAALLVAGAASSLARGRGASPPSRSTSGQARGGARSGCARCAAHDAPTSSKPSSRARADPPSERERDGRPRAVSSDDVGRAAAREATAFEASLRAAGRPHHRRVQAAIASRGRAARRLRPGGDRARLRGGGRGGDLGAHRADVLRRSPGPSARRCARSCDIPLLRKDFIVTDFQIARSARRRRRRRAAHRRRARRRDA